MFHRQHRRVTLDCGSEEITMQKFKDECDIHNILKQYSKTGIITHVQKAQINLGDLPDVIDYQSSMNLIINAEQNFALLPSAVRDYFQNDPAQFLAAFTDPSQDEKLREFGLITPKADARTQALSESHTPASTSE